MTTIEKVLVTPETAAEWLTNAKRQRRIRQPGVMAYAADMRAGRWREDITPIVFDATGNLSNGQHRLSAVVLSGVSVEFWVMRGIDPESVMTMDSGMARRSADQLRLHDVPNATQTAAIAKTILRVEMFPDKVWTTPTTADITKSMIQDEVIGHLDEYVAANHESERVKRYAVRTQWGALAMLMSRHSNNADLWPAFREGVVTGAGLDANDPRLALRAYHIRVREMKRWGEGQCHLFAYIHAWNKYVADEPMKLLKMPRKEQLPLPKVL